jgi:RNA polymerase sigma factor (sigma-70 family)
MRAHIVVVEHADTVDAERRSAVDAQWRRIIAANHRRLHTYVRSFAGSAHEGAELEQATWCLAWERFGAGDGADVGWTAILSCCQEAGRNQERSRRRDLAVRIELAHDARVVEATYDAHLRDDDRAWSCFLLLSSRQREVVAWRLFDSKSEKETAVLVGCAVGTVKVHYHRGLAKLRRLAWD